ncbi:MAG: hypothetical protein HUJ26_07510 [Planctomycetaceae bacterium]|nr:hypothetical protein [Planctomycetaceae bacterium]
MKLDVLKKFAALVSVVCVSFAAVGCAPPAEEAPAGDESSAAEEAPAGDEAPAEDGAEAEGTSATE